MEVDGESISPPPADSDNDTFHDARSYPARTRTDSPDITINSRSIAHKRVRRTGPLPDRGVKRTAAAAQAAAQAQAGQAQNVVEPDSDSPQSPPRKRRRAKGSAVESGGAPAASIKRRKRELVLSPPYSGSGEDPMHGTKAVPTVNGKRARTSARKPPSRARPVGMTRRRQRSLSSSSSTSSSSFSDSSDSSSDSSIAIVFEKRAPSRPTAQRKGVPKGTANAGINFVPTGIPSFSSTLSDVTDALKRIDDLRVQGNTFYNAEDYGPALSCYNEALQMYYSISSAPPSTASASLPPPLTLLSNQAAAYIALENYEDAIKSMHKALEYPSTDAEGTVKRMSRLARCYVKLGKIDGEGAETLVRIMGEQIQALKKGSRADDDKVRWHIEHAEKGRAILKQSVEALRSMEQARTAADWKAVLSCIKTIQDSGVPIRKEWNMARAEAWLFLGQTTYATPLLSYLFASSPTHPASTWFRALLAYNNAEISTCFEALEKLRRRHELPLQGLKLYDKVYKLASLSKQTKEYVRQERWKKVVLAAAEVLRVVGDQPMGRKIGYEALLARSEAYLKQCLYAESMRDSEGVAAWHEQAGRTGETVWFRAKVLQAKGLSGNPSRKAADVQRAVRLLEEALQYEARQAVEIMYEAKALLRSLRKTAQSAGPSSQRPSASDPPGASNGSTRNGPRAGSPKIDRWHPLSSPWVILNLPPGATKEEIRKAYKRCSLETHPDKAKDGNGDDERFKRVSAAYKMLIGET